MALVLGTSDADSIVAAGVSAGVSGLPTPQGDSIDGGASADTIEGGDGADTLHGGSGADRLVGGRGSDLFIVDDAGDAVVEALDEGADTILAALSWTLPAHVEALRLTGGAKATGTGNVLANLIIGTAFADRLLGDGGADTLIGDAGDDTLDGGSDADRMEGGAGNDIYIVAEDGDSIIEAQDAGADSVASSVSWILGANLENLALTGAAGIDGVGNELANRILGNAAVNHLAGEAGRDTLDGGVGDDTLDGGGDADSLSGGAGNDSLTGGAGPDTMFGGAGNDSYLVDDVADRIVETRTGGADTVHASLTWTLGAHQEDLVLIGTAAIDGIGNNLNNVIHGNDAANQLIGAGRADTLIGGRGNDLYLIDATDLLIEQAGGGLDTVVANATFALPDHIEVLRFNGTANVRGDGNAEDNFILGNVGSNRLLGYDGEDTLNGGLGDDTLQGGDGADSLVGGTGNDRLDGGLGDDTYVVVDADLIIELVDSGIDTVLSASTLTLPGAVENLSLLGNADLSGTGNALANVLSGNSGANLLRGLAGDDVVSGGNGADTLEGGADRDRLSGGGGSDRLVGGAGNDTLAGDSGFDTAVYVGMAADYAVVRQGTVTYLVQGIAGAGLAEGADSLSGVELLRFADQAVRIGPNAAPTDILLAPAAVQENAAGVVIGQLTVLDPDGEEPMLFAMSDSRFEVTAGNQLRLKSGVALDHEAAPVVTLTVTATDTGGLSVARELAIAVGNVNEAPAAADIVFEAGTDAPVAGRLIGDDEDADDDADSLTYSFVGGLPAGKGQLTLGAGGAFTFDPLDDFSSLGGGQVERLVVQYFVTDRHGLASDLRTLTIDVTAEPEGPPETPQITGIETDTGVAGDQVTADPTLMLLGTAQPGANVEVLLDGEVIGTARALPSGVWSFDYGATALPEGEHGFTARTTTPGGAVSEPSLPYVVTVDTTAPGEPELRLASTSDTGAAGDGVTALARVTLLGTAEPGALVELEGTARKALVAADGSFVLPDVELATGANTLDIRVVDAAGNSSERSFVLTRAEATGPDPVLAWNQATLDAIRDDAAIPTFATRALAMESIAVLDTLAAIDGTPAFMIGLAAPDGIPAEAAVAAAAHRVLSYLFPAQHADFDARLAADLDAIVPGTARDQAVAFGQAVADAVIALRDSDGWDAFATYNGGTEPGAWRPTAPMFEVAQAPQWANLTPFTLLDGSQFRADAPRELTSAEYAAALDEVQRFGSATSTERTAEQTEIARFWADGLGSYTPPGHWNAIANQLAAEEGYALGSAARLLAILNVTLADASIAAWDTKYEYGFWRPITAIRNADQDGNADTVQDATWQPLLITPNHPEYVSGHSTYSGAAASVLTELLGALPFTTATFGLPGVTRSFDDVWDAAAEAGRSRVYGGIHYEFSNQAGQALGSDVAAWVLDSFRTDVDTRAPILLLDQRDGAVLTAAPVLSGYALDNLSGLDTLLVWLDDAPAQAVAVDARGRFAIDVADLFGAAAEGAHVLHLSAADAAGNASRPLSYDFAIDTTAPTIALTGLADGGILAAGARLQGSADGTGSPLLSLSYSWNGGIARPLVFDGATGAFDAALDLRTLAPGAQTLTVTARDAAGFTSTTNLALSLPEAVPFAVASLTPSDGAGDVGVTFRPQVNFTRAVDAATLTPESFFATDAGGTELPGSIVVSPDGLRAWLFLQEALPGATRVTLHLDGDAIRAAGDGTLLDGDGNATPGGDLASSFTTVSRTAVPGTTLKGFVVGPGADLKPMTYDDFRAGPDGAAHTADDVFLERLAGVKVFILGMEDKFVLTDEQGAFELTDVPTGVVKVAIDGRTATNAPADAFFPEMVMDVTIRPGQVNTLMGTMGSTAEQLENLGRGEIYLPRIATSVLTEIDDDAPTTVTVPAEGTTGLTPEQRGLIQLVVQPGSVVGEDGQPLEDALVGISTVPPELVRDMLPPGLLQHGFDITIQAPGAAVFDQPLQLTLPNVFNAAPGSKQYLLSFDHTTGRLEVAGTATVSADGLFVRTDPGSGVVSPGWHVSVPGSSGSGPGTPNDEKKCEISAEQKAQESAAMKEFFQAIAEIGFVIAGYVLKKGKAVLAAKAVAELTYDIYINF